MAVSIRILLHDTQNSKSLLGMLGWKDGYSFLNTAYPYDPENILSHHGLVGLKLSSSSLIGKYYAPLGDSNPRRPCKFIKFSDWWNENIIVDKNNQTFNRRELVLALSNKDGGAHVDPELDEPYANLTRGNSVGWLSLSSSEKNDIPMLDVEKHSIRQIAYEVIKSVIKMKCRHGAG